MTKYGIKIDGFYGGVQYMTKDGSYISYYDGIDTCPFDTVEELEKWWATKPEGTWDNWYKVYSVDGEFKGWYLQ